jgi:EAL domain-containing protein (putative c-di-GMP-specific phosphodiesterase class I)/GGDEF domain-containing protein
LCDLAWQTGFYALGNYLTQNGSDNNLPTDNQPHASLSDDTAGAALHRQMRAYEERHDSQTGLLNGEAFQELLAGMLHERGASREVALVWIDVLNLRREFALWGAQGVEVQVAQVAETLRSVVGRSSTDPSVTGPVVAGRDTLIGRCSTDCILVAIEADKFNKSHQRRIQSIAEALAPLRAPGSGNKIETAVGVAFWPSDAASAEELVRFASLAASRAGYLRSPQVQGFRVGMNYQMLRENHLEVEMRRCFESGTEREQFGLVYQPKIEVATGHVLGAEALIRWNHPKLGTIAPTEFIPVAERSELIQRIVEFALNTALRDVQRWQEQGLSLPLISVNMSWANLRREDFVPAVRARLAQIPIAPARLELEVTESVLMDDEELFAARVRQLQAIGVRVAIDDFGTRYTGFNALRRIPVDAMKIDRCFIQGIDRSRDARALCATIVAMARQLKLRTVAEGVELPGEFEVLKEIGCDAAQGYLFQRPVPAAELAAFLLRWPKPAESRGFVLQSQQIAAILPR